jgi:ADP-ribosylglycohydrolase
MVLQFGGDADRTAPWRHTDDTEMAASVIEHLGELGSISQAVLAAIFAARMDPARGYGHGAEGLLTFIRQGLSWRVLASAAMGGEGSFGNGAAMRVAPLGAFFADDLARVSAEARLSAEVTHSHPEGIAGAIAVAVGAALACRSEGMTGDEYLRAVLEWTPKSLVRDRLEDARGLLASNDLQQVADRLGNGAQVSAMDTVPFCLWIAARGLDFEESLWRTVSVLGDRDTTCAIVGGIVACRSGIGGIPESWHRSREPLPAWGRALQLQD